MKFTQNARRITIINNTASILDVTGRRTIEKGQSLEMPSYGFTTWTLTRKRREHKDWVVISVDHGALTV